NPPINPPLATQAVSSDGSISCSNTTFLTGTCVYHPGRNTSIMLIYSGTTTWSSCHSPNFLRSSALGDCRPPSGNITGSSSQSCTMTFTSPGNYTSRYNVWCG